MNFDIKAIVIYFLFYKTDKWNQDWTRFPFIGKDHSVLLFYGNYCEKFKHWHSFRLISILGEKQQKKHNEPKHSDICIKPLCNAKIIQIGPLKNQKYIFSWILEWISFPKSKQSSCLLRRPQKFDKISQLMWGLIRILGDLVILLKPYQKTWTTIENLNKNINKVT